MFSRSYRALIAQPSAAARRSWTLPLSRASSSGRRLPTRDEVPKIHGELDPSEVKSKAMRAKLLKQEKEAALREEYERQRLNQLANPQQPNVLQEQNTPPPPQYDPQLYRPVTLGESMKAHFFSGIMITMGFIAVMVLFKAIFGDSDGGDDSAKVAYLNEIEQEFQQAREEQAKAKPSDQLR